MPNIDVSDYSGIPMSLTLKTCSEEGKKNDVESHA
jgi:hypothetical protein